MLFRSEQPKFNFQKPVFSTNVEKENIVEKLDLPKASEVPIARDYLEKRRLDPEKFYFAEDFKEFVNSLKQTFAKTDTKESRIVIPLYYKKNLVGIQGRALGPSQNKYITIMLDDSAPKIYGLDDLKIQEQIYVTEGPFDSTFISNAIALCGADGDLNKWGINDPVWIYDNEPRNREILSRISRVIEMGQKVVIWPSTIKEKDINDMVLSGLDAKSIVESNIYCGL